MTDKELYGDAYEDDEIEGRGEDFEAVELSWESDEIVPAPDETTASDDNPVEEAAATSEAAILGEDPWEEDAQEEDDASAMGAARRDRRGRTANRNTTVLLVVCAVAIGAVYLLGLRHRPQEPTSEDQIAEAQLDMALARLTGGAPAESGGAGTSSATLLQAFYDYPQNRQVDLAALAHNPFQPVRPQIAQAAEQNRQRAEQAAAQQRIARMRQLEESFRRLRLESILIAPSSPQCMINGEVFAPGDMVRDEFKIKDISNQQVLMVAEQTEFVLQL